jgi:hypothetical protein
VLERLPDYGVVAKLVESILSRHYTVRDAVIHGQQNVTV